MSSADTPAEHFRRVTGAVMRAISEHPELAVTYGADAKLVGENARLPAPSRDVSPREVSALRGKADSMALKLRHHDDGLHSRLGPSAESARTVYDMLEQIRVEAIGANRMKGVAANLTAALNAHCLDKRMDSPADREDIALDEIVGLYVRERLGGVTLPEAALETLESWRPWLEERISTDLATLEENVDDQLKYAQAMSNLLSHLDLLDESDEMSEGEKSDDDDEREDSEEAEGEAEDDDEAEEGEQDGMPDGDPDQASEDDEQEMSEQAQPEMMPGEGDEELEQRVRQRPEGYISNSKAEAAYKAFTTDFDEVVLAEDLCEAEEMARLRLLLDQQLSHLQTVIGKLANRLQRKLMAKQSRSWEFDLEEGMLDAGKLSRIITNPELPLSYKQEKDTSFRDTVVTLLIDNSGSMRGRPITVAAMSADILARTLERCGVKVEILGFTTRAWKGGEAREEWLAGGKQPSPGRLNDLRHIIYKPADAPWRRAHKNLGLMLREGLLKENIDGEALLWAYNRLMARPEQRKILMVVSDGAPVDDSTLSVNPGNYLERHLREVIEWIEMRTPVELTAIGIGHDVTRYYRRAITIMDAEQLGGTVMERLTELFEDSEADAPARRRYYQRGAA